MWLAMGRDFLAAFGDDVKQKLWIKLAGMALQSCMNFSFDSDLDKP